MPGATSTAGAESAALSFPSTNFTVCEGYLFKNAEGAGSTTYTGVLTSSGTGSGTGNFRAATGSKYFHFGNMTSVSTDVELVTAPLNTQACSQLSFKLIEGNNTNGGSTPESSDTFRVYYSADGTRWTLFSTHTPNGNSGWQTKNIVLPVAAKAPRMYIKLLAYVSHSGLDEYGVDDISLPGATYTP